MSTDPQTGLQAATEHLRPEIDALKARLTAFQEETRMELQAVTNALRLELEALRARQEGMESSRTAVHLPTNNDYLEYFNERIQEQLKRLREEQDGEFAFAVLSSVAQSGRDGHIGTAFGLTTFDTISNLPTDEQIARRRERALLYLNPVVLPVLRTFYELRFAGKPMRATAEELAIRLGCAVSEIEAALHPLVENKTIQRGLFADNTLFYQWDGNSTVAVSLLFND